MHLSYKNKKEVQIIEIYYCYSGNYFNLEVYRDGK